MATDFRLSVALCTFNGGHYLDEQLNSLLAQTRPPDELVVCDDGSTDNTLDRLERFAGIVPFPVHIWRNPITLGSTRNFNQAISRCVGDIIFLCDQDDVCLPDKLARFEAVFAANPDVGLVASDLEVVAASGLPVGQRVWDNLPFHSTMQVAVERGDGPRIWVRYNTITGAAAAVRSRLRDVICPIPEFWVHDGWIALIAGSVSSVRLLSEPLTRYRTHSAQQIGSRPLPIGEQIRAARRMDAAYFARTAECFAAAADRLEQFAERVRHPDTIQLLRGKADFARTQQRMREGWRVGRIGPAVRQLVAGNYHRFGRGWKGFAADLLL